MHIMRRRRHIKHWSHTDFTNFVSFVFLFFFIDAFGFVVTAGAFCWIVAKTKPCRIRTCIRRVPDEAQNKQRPSETPLHAGKTPQELTSAADPSVEELNEKQSWHGERAIRSRTGRERTWFTESAGWLCCLWPTDWNRMGHLTLESLEAIPRFWRLRLYIYGTHTPDTHTHTRHTKACF